MPEMVLERFLAAARVHKGRTVDSSKAVEYLNRGVDFARAGRLSEAVSAYKRAVDFDPQLFEAHFNLALALEKTGRPASALAYWSQAMRLKPGTADIYYRIGLNLEKQKKTYEAWAFYVLAERYDPTEADYPYHAGLIAFANGDFRTALPFVERAAGLRPRGDILVNLAALYLNLGRLDQAESTARRAARAGADAGRILAEIRRRRH